jgi:predicted nucleic acid-binding protein
VTRYVLDSSIYIEAIRDRTKSAWPARVHDGPVPRIALHAVVVRELLAGSAGALARRKSWRDLVEPFERRGRLLTPSYAAWRREIVASLVDRGELTAGGIPRSFTNDTLIAASCREEGVTLITRNVRDFERIRKVERVQFAEPWPAS